MNSPLFFINNFAVQHTNNISNLSKIKNHCLYQTGYIPTNKNELQYQAGYIHTIVQIKPSSVCNEIRWISSVMIIHHINQ